MKKILCVLFMLLPCSLFANTVNLTWNRNTETDLAGYNIYRATAPGQYGAKLNATLIPQPAGTAKPTYTDTTPTNTTYYYVVRAVNMAGLESANSNEVIANPIAPLPPTGLQIVSTVSLLINQVKVASTNITQSPQTLNYLYVLAPIRPPRQTERTLTVVVEQIP